MGGFLNTLQIDILSHSEIEHGHIWPVFIPCGVYLRLVIHHYLFNSFPIKHDENITKIELKLWNHKYSEHNDYVIKSDPRSDWWIANHQMPERRDQNKKRNWYNYEGMKESQCHVYQSKLCFRILIPCVPIQKHCVENKSHVQNTNRCKNNDQRCFYEYNA